MTMYRVRFEEDEEESETMIDAFDPEDAAADFCEERMGKGDFADGIPHEIEVVVKDDAGAVCRVQVTHDWSPTFYGYAISNEEKTP